MIKPIITSSDKADKEDKKSETDGRGFDPDLTGVTSGEEAQLLLLLPVGGLRRVLASLRRRRRRCRLVFRLPVVVDDQFLFN